jgi:hypothetical protein
MKSLSLLSIALLTIIIAGFLSSCDDEPLQNNKIHGFNAEPLTETQISTNYIWYGPNMAEYTPDVALINEIKNLFKPGEHKFLIYFKPSCQCPETLQLFPETMKVLHAAGIPDSNIKIYSIMSPTTSFPEQDLFKIKDLPMVMLMKNQLPVYSVIDSLTYTKTELKDTLSVEAFTKRALLK